MLERIPGDSAALGRGELPAKGFFEIGQGQAAMLFVGVEESGPEGRSGAKAQPARQEDKKASDQTEKSKGY
jgi:hypothetical protein